MDDQSTDKADANTIAVLNGGFVRLVDHMGSDASVVQAARVSYGAGTKSVSEDRGLIRYLMRAEHMTPFEMTAVKLHLKLPIFVMRQLVRHRSASLNEESARYSEMCEEFYVPEPGMVQPQSSDNKQGRAGTLSHHNTKGVIEAINTAHDNSLSAYRTLLGERSQRVDEWYDPYGDHPMFEEDFPGIARETARGVMPLSTYTQVYWQQNLRNLLHMIRLRADAHAQYEIRVYADAIVKLIEPLFPVSVEAFRDYVQGGLSLSRMETELLNTMMRANLPPADHFRALIEGAGSLKVFAAERGMSLREMREFSARFGFSV